MELLFMYVPISYAITTGYTIKEIQDFQEKKHRIQTYEFLPCLLGCLTYIVLYIEGI